MYMPAIACLLMLSSLIVPSTSTGQVHYVKPESMSNCSYHPCLTLDHYVAEETQYFTAGSVFIFLAGHHSFQTAINISNITLRGEDSGVIISDGITPISFQSSRKLTIEGLVFRDWHVSVLSFYNCSDVLVSNSSIEWIIADAKTLSVYHWIQQYSKRIYSLRFQLSILNCYMHKLHLLYYLRRHHQ